MKGNKKINLKKIVLCLFVGLMVLVGLVICLVLWRGSTKDIEAVADSFRPLEGWQQTKYKVVPPQFLCLMGNCPEMSKSWIVKGKITQNDAKKFIENFSQVNTSHSQCVDYDDGTALDSCEYVGERGRYQFSVMVEYKNSTNDTEIYLFIRRKGQIYD